MENKSPNAELGRIVSQGMLLQRSGIHSSLAPPRPAFRSLIGSAQSMGQPVSIPMVDRSIAAGLIRPGNLFISPV